MKALFTALAMSTLLSACSSSPVSHFYILEAQAEPESQSAATVAIGVGPVSTANYLDNPRILTSPNGVELSSSPIDLWAEPLHNGITRVITANLVALTGNHRIRPFPWRSDEQPQLAIKVEVLELNANAGTADLYLRWSIRHRQGSEPLAEGFSRYTEPLQGTGYTAVSKAYSALLAQFSRHIARQLQHQAQ